MNRTFLIATKFFAVLLIFSVGGCATYPSWIYRVDRPVTQEPLINKTVAVLPLLDAREGINRSMFGIAIIPLVPFGWETFTFPDMPKGIIFKERISKSISEELNACGLFKEAYYAERPADADDLIMKGVLRRSEYKGKLFSYCLSVYGWIPWVLGLPTTQYKNELWIELQLIEKDTGEVLWSDAFRREISVLSWLYVPKSDFYFNKLLKGMMRDAIPSLQQEFSGENTGI